MTESEEIQAVQEAIDAAFPEGRVTIERFVLTPRPMWRRVFDWARGGRFNDPSAIKTRLEWVHTDGKKYAVFLHSVVGLPAELTVQRLHDAVARVTQS